MPNVRALLVALGLAFSSVPLVAHPVPLTWPELLSRPRPAPSATIHYADDALQVVDVWIPKGRGPFPTVLMVHGGCWTTSIADRHIMDWAAEDLRRRGLAVWNIDYRGVDRPGGGYPGTFRDVGAAADALAKNARRFRLDTRRIVAVGHSAGGHLALWLAGRRRLPTSSPLRGAHPLRISAVVSLGGLPDLEENAKVANGCGTIVSATLAGGNYAQTSVPRLAPLGVAQTLVNGRQDDIIPPRLATDYQRRMRAAGDAVAIRWVPNAGHVDLVAPGTPAWAVAVQSINAALHR
jgi:acetyl esterase/lipase